MRIPCPWCGERDSAEFRYLGDAAPKRPSDSKDESRGGGAPTPASVDPAWYEYVYLRENPGGAHRELWFHEGGCRLWLVVHRDTRSHVISAAHATS